MGSTRQISGISIVDITAEETTSLTNKDVDRALKIEDLECRKIETDLKREELKGHEQDRTERKNFANKIFYLLIGFLSVSIILLFMSGYKCIPFELSDKILMTILVTTTADVIGIFLFVVRYLFKANHICPHCGKNSYSRKILNAKSVLKIED